MEDTRCCGTGTCLIEAHGRCWCGQQWDDEKMCNPHPSPTSVDNKVSIDHALGVDDVKGKLS